MCGINGFNFQDRKTISSMNKAIKHRGPDGSGIYEDKNITLGHVRLSIIDLTKTGSQPMTYKKGKKEFTIVYNGEIYNYKELKEELIKKGHEFNSTSDTEVILLSYLEWGEDCVNKFNGMWAFCIHDKSKNILFLSRDRMGVKPLYYYNKTNRFIFSSEIKGILEHKELKLNSIENINKVGIGFYFSTDFIPSPHTIYNNVYKLEPRQNLIYNLKKSKIDKLYYYYNLPKFNPIKNKKQLKKEGRNILEDSTKLRMRSDVKVGAFLSGGLDSNAILTTMSKYTNNSKIETFSIGFKNKNDETPYINLVKKKVNIKNHHKYFDRKDFDKILKDYSKIYDEPFGDYSGFPTYYVSDYARNNNIKVVLTGDGGDEIFSGYILHKIAAQMDLINKIPKLIRKGILKLPNKKSKGSNSFTKSEIFKEAIRISLEDKNKFFSERLKIERYKSKEFNLWTNSSMKKSLKLSNNNLTEAMRIYDAYFNTLPDKYLTKVDRASMRCGVEVRSPFLDYRFYEYSMKIPTSWKTDSFNTKKFMKEIYSDIIPKEILNKKKKGFSFGIDNWLFEKYDNKLLEKKVKLFTKNKIFNKELSEFYLNKVIPCKNNRYSHPKILLALFINWYDTWIK